MENKETVKIFETKLQNLKNELKNTENDFNFFLKFENLTLEEQFLGLLKFNNFLSLFDEMIVKNTILNYLSQHGFKDIKVELKNSKIICIKHDENHCIRLTFELFDEKSIYVSPAINKKHMIKSNGLNRNMQKMFDAYFLYKNEKSIKNFHNYLDTRFVDMPRILQYFSYIRKNNDLDKKYEEQMKKIEDYNKEVEENDNLYNEKIEIFKKNLDTFKLFIKHFDEMNFDITILFDNIVI